MQLKLAELLLSNFFLLSIYYPLLHCLFLDLILILDFSITIWCFYVQYGEEIYRRYFG